MEMLNVRDYISIILIVWLALLSFYLFRTVSHYKKLTKGESNLNLGQILEKALASQEMTTKQITAISSQITGEQQKALRHFQKSALIRFNPFEDAGGDQSFVIALLDGENNGIVMSSLHSRGGTRIYAKSVLASKAATHQFSKEEKEAVEKAARHVS